MFRYQWTTQSQYIFDLFVNLFISYAPKLLKHQGHHYEKKLQYKHNMSEEEQQQQQNGNSWIGSPSRNSWIKELEDFCGSDDLSVDELRRMTKGSYDLEGSSYHMHRSY